MELKYNVTGERRKELVNAVSQQTGVAPIYKGAPTFSYVVWNYTIGRNGELMFDDRIESKEEIEALLIRLAVLGFEFETEAEAREADTLRMELAYETQRELEAQNVPDYSNRGPYGGDEIPDEDDDADDADKFTVEMTLDGFNPDTLDNLTKLVTAKEALIMAALGADELPIQLTDKALRFPWFTLDDPSHAAYYVQFIWALCKTSKEKKRVTAKERGMTNNPKYAMRCFLLSLGLIGDEYKNARKLLLARLSGNASFRGGTPPTYTVHCYTLENGEEEDPMVCETFEYHNLAIAKEHAIRFSEECDGLYFAGVHVEDEQGKYLYEITMDGTVTENE